MVWVLFTVLTWGGWVPLHLDGAPFASRTDCEKFGATLQKGVPEKIEDTFCIKMSADDYKRAQAASDKQYNRK